MADNKTEQPTPRRRQKAREKGQVARSRELSGTLAMVAMFGVLAWTGQDMLRMWAATFRQSVELSMREQFSYGGPIMFWNAMTVMRAMVPLWGMAFVVALGCGVAQGGFVFAPEALQPKFDRISPGSKLKQMFSLTGMAGILKSLVPFSAMAYIGVRILFDHWGEMAASSSLGLRSFSRLLLSMMVEVGWKCGLVLVAWAAIDYFLAWRKVESDLKMTRQEIRDEMKDSEGNPQIKGRIRFLQREMRKRQTLKAASKATVVVVNPTHFAVALRYEMDMEAPMVVAKGRDLLAMQIKEIARWEGIPIMENPPLARALYRAVEVGQSIPSKLYQAVAEILVVVFRAQAEAAQREAARRRPNPEGVVNPR